MFLSNWLVFKIVLAAVTGLVDYPLAADVLLKYDNANKLYLDGNSIDYVSNVVLYKGETSYEISESLNLDISNEQIVYASDADDAAGGQFGRSCAISGDYIAIGRQEVAINSVGAAGAVYVLKRSGNTFVHDTKLYTNNPTQNEMVGISVDIDGNYLVAGSYNGAAAYIFKRDTVNDTWSQTAKLTGNASSYFGISVSISGDYVIVGAYMDDTGGTNRGTAYIFKRDTNAETWSQTTIQANDATNDDYFGYSVSIDGNYAIIGAYGDDDNGSSSGSVYIFKRDATSGSWSQQQKLTASNGAQDDWFGMSVSIDDDYAIVGAVNGDSTVTDSGTAYIFVRDTTTDTWSEQQKLTAGSDAALSDGFGSFVGIDGRYAIIGAPLNDDGGSTSGSVYIFKRSGTTWTEDKKIVASDAGAGDQFGSSVAIENNTICVGAHIEGTYGSQSGAAYIYSSQLVTNYYITQPGTYRADLQICGIDYKTNEVEVTGTPTSSKVTQISTGGNVSLALTQDGFVYAWGEDTYGQMGQGTTDTNVNTPVKVKGVGGSGFLSNITKISCGGRHCIALASDGTLYAWGDNTEGQIGDASNTERKTPVTVSYSGDPVSNISAGFLHSALTTTTGKVYCWGQGTNGQIGDNQSSSDRTSPVQVVGVGNSGTLTGIRDVTCGDSFTHAIKDSDGSVYGWGKQLYGMIGNGQNSGDALTPTSVILASDSSAVTGITQISGGGDSSLMLKSDGTVYACGYNGLGQIGNGSTSDADSGLVQVLGVGGSGYLTGITQIAIAYASSLALKSDGTMYSWGNNTDGQNGLGTDGGTDGGTNPTTPVAITLLTDVDTINTGGKPSHFIASKLDGSIFCWGKGDSGQIGDGTNTDDQGTPTQVLAGAGPSVDGKFNLLTEPRLTFDNYNKLSLLHELSSVSSKLTYGSNVYDIGTLTSDITIEKQGEYASLTFDTSSNVAYFSNVTVGAIASTMAGYEVEQIINGFASTTVHFSSQGGFGGYIDFNGDGTRMVLGASTSFSSAQGRAYVYHLEDGSWVQKVDIPSPNTSYQRFGDSVLMNEDGTRIAVNQWTYDRIHIYEYTNGAWPTSPTTSITTSNNSGKGDMDWNKDGTVIVAGDGSESSTRKTYVYRLNGGTWTETNIGSVGHGVAINGAGTRVLIGANSVGKIYEANYDSGTSTWSSLTEVHTSSSSWPVRIRMDEDGTTAVAINGTNGQGRILERQSGTSWTSVMDVQGRCSFYGRGSGSISYDGTMVLTGDNYYNPGSVTAQGRAYLYQYSGGSWSLTKTYENPDASPATNDYWGYGTAMAKNTKDRLAIGMTGDDTAGADYGSVHIYTNAIPDFISFDTYNKLSLSGITKPTSKLHALPTGAESTTTYDIGTATNIYIESAGTYTVAMKGSSAFALDSTVVGTVTPLPTDYVKIPDIPVDIYTDSSYIRTTTSYTNSIGQTVYPGVKSSFTYNGGAYEISADSCADGNTEGANYQPWHVFTSILGDTTYSYYNTANYVNVPSWLKIKIPSAKVAVGFFLLENRNEHINGFKIQGSNNDSDWTDLYTGTTVGMTTGISPTFSNSTAYQYYRLYVTSLSSSGNNYWRIDDWNMHFFGYVAPPSLNFDTYNKLTFTGADTGSTYKLKYESNTYDLGTISNVYIANPGTYSAEIKGATNFALSSNVATIQALPTRLQGSDISAMGTTNYTRYGVPSSQSIDVEDFLFNSSSNINPCIDFIHLTNSQDTFVFDLESVKTINKIRIYAGNTTPNWASRNTGSVVKLYNGSTLVYTSPSLTFSRSSPETYYGPYEEGKDYNTLLFTTGYTNIDKITVETPSTSAALGRVEVNDFTDTPSLTFDGYNKLTLSGLESGSTSNVLFNGNTYSIGTASNVYIENTGTYEAESKGTTTFALTKNVVGAIASKSPVTVAFHFNTFSWGGDPYSDGSVTAAATAGHIYSDTPTGTYTWGSLDSASTASQQTTYTWTPASTVTAKVLMVAGGGGGGNSDNGNGGGGGGGAGGVVYNSSVSLSGQQTITVGGNNSAVRGDGVSTTFTGLTTAFGGGKGAGSSGGASAGGSGGGAFRNGTGGAGTSGQGYAGGNGSSTYSPWADQGGSGGGGAGGSGADATGPNGANGGIGLDYSSVFGTTYGDSGWFASGGGGGFHSGSPGTASNGGGTSGGATSGSTGATGQKHTGGGGGGGSIASGPGSYGGSGIVLVQIPPASPSLTHDGYKLVVKNITPTSTTLKYGSNTYEIGTATNIYVENTGDYTAEIGGAADFALTNTTVSGTLKTVEPVINGGFQFGHALTYDGKLYGWGENSDGELGVGDSTDKTVPTLCTGIPQGDVVSIWDQSKRGESRWAKTRDGRIWVTGNHASYCLPGSSANFITFTDVSAQFGDYTQTATSVVWASGSERATQVLMENGDVWSFGNDAGAAGILGQGGSPTSDRTPRKLSGISNVTKIVYNGDLVLALDLSNVVWMWGSNSIGNGSPNWGPYNVPTNIMGTGTANLTSLLVSGETVTDIECGSYSMFVITSKGTVYATGKNGSGQLGQGGTTAKSSSDGWVKIEYFTSNAITVNRLYTGQGEPHVFADTSDGWYCWGENGVGQLGLGDTTDKTSPVKWTNVSNIKTFGVGESCHYAIAEDGKYYAWGSGGTNRRGDANTGDITYPKYIDTLPNILAPSFDYDGYDKVFVNNPPSGKKFTYIFEVAVASYDTTILCEVSASGYTIKESDITVLVGTNQGIEKWVNGIVLNDACYVASEASVATVGTKLFTIETDVDVTSFTIGTQKPKYMPGWKIYKNGVAVLTEGSNRGSSSSPEPVSYSYSLGGTGQYNTDWDTKYTKDTHTYDANQAQIVTVSEPGTYDAQIKGTTPFSLKSATVPATKASGLYTWAFHHGNFDNAYGDGDILTARDNGRFYADTPAYTGDIGTISTELVVSSTQNFASTISPTGTGDWVGLYTWGLDTSQNTSTARFYELSTGSVKDGFEIRFENDSTVLYCDSSNNEWDPGWVSTTSSTTPAKSKTLILGETVDLYRNYNPASTKVGSFTVTTGHLFSTATSNKLHTTYTFTPASTLTANVLMVAGGGGGGQTSGGSAGGGGAGGLLYYANQSITIGTKTIVVGNGGANHVNGNDTTFTLLTTTFGGGRGATAGETGGNGGSGGGTSHNYPTSPGTGVSDQGNAGGNGGNDTYRTGGGGGGAGGVGGNASTSSQLGGVGGIGLNYSNVFGSFYGESGWFAGGGAGCSQSTATPAVGGIGGGGYSSTSVSTANALSGQSHTGGGGGGAGGKGGSGIVLLQTNVATPNVNSEVKIPEPHCHVLIEKPDDTQFSHLPSLGNNSVHASGSIVPNIPRADGSVSNVYYSTSTGYFTAAQAGSLVSTVEGIFYPIQQERYDNILEIGHNSTNDVELEMAADGTAKLYRNNGGNELASGTVKCFTVGKWHHIALTLDTNRNAVGYVNGYPVVSATYASAKLPLAREQMCLYRTGVTATFRKFLMYYFKTYNSVLNQKQIMALAGTAGLGPKLEYDGLNAINVVNTEPGSGTEITIYESNVNDTSNLYVVSCNESSYTLSNAGTYYAQIKGTDTFTITRPLTVTDDHFPLYQYPPIDGTTTGLTTSTTTATWTISGVQYSTESSVAGSPYNTFDNSITSGFDSTSSTGDITITFESSKTIRKYIVWPYDSTSPVSTPGGNTDPTLSTDGTFRPKSWVLYGTNNLNDWSTVLDTVTNQPPSIYGDVHSISSPASYQYYKLSVTANNGGSGLKIGEWQLWGDA
jgi:alpha-tubulin suppressor-like RCC1 family protein